MEGTFGWLQAPATIRINNLQAATRGRLFDFTTDRTKRRHHLAFLQSQCKIDESFAPNNLPP
jgi:hypothetical protein